MQYISTRNKQHKVSSAEAILQGISPDGGLFVPETIPTYTLADIEELSDLDYNQRAVKVLGSFLTDFTNEEIINCVYSAYNDRSFPAGEITPIKKIDEGLFSLELWHGPTNAFKDMALQILPYLLTTAAKKLSNKKDIVILVATSGDTGKAALEGFKNVDGTSIIVFYPDGGVSPVQYLQMATQEGNNVAVYAVKGNFDDTQSTVKEIFTDKLLGGSMSQNNKAFSSANSINWGRLLPQIVYYLSAYCDLYKKGEIELGEKINVSVPTGNFGNILAAYYAKQMGVPIDKFICASNSNNVLADFINTGTYDANRDFVLTSSPSMDILISSNLERLLYLISGDDKLVKEFMLSLKESGVYTIPKELRDKLKQEFIGDYCTEDETFDTIRNSFKSGYLADTHTAVAIGVYNKCKNQLKNAKTIVASTASPYKFPGSMLKALDPNRLYKDDFSEIFVLRDLTGVEIPKNILDLQTKDKRFTKVIDRQDMLAAVKDTVGLK